MARSLSVDAAGAFRADLQLTVHSYKSHASCAKSHASCAAADQERSYCQNLDLDPTTGLSICCGGRWGYIIGLW